MSDTGVAGCVVLLVVFLLIGPIIGAICWPYTLNTWLEYAGKEPAVEWWHGALLGLVPGVGHLALPGVVLTWILMLFLA